MAKNAEIECDNNYTIAVGHDGPIKVFVDGQTSIIGRTKEQIIESGDNLWTAMYVDMDSYCNTCVLKTSQDSFIVLYTDFKHKGEDGQLYKSIKIKEIKVKPKN